MMLIDVVDTDTIAITDNEYNFIMKMHLFKDYACVCLGGEVDSFDVEQDIEGVYIKNIYDVVKHASEFVGLEQQQELSVAIMTTYMREPMYRFFTLLEGAEWVEGYPTGPGIVWGNLVEVAATPGIYTSNEFYEIILFRGNWDKEDLFDSYWDAYAESYVVNRRC